MGRKRTLLKLNASQREELNQHLHTDGDPRARERSQFALWAASGQHTLEDLARLVGRQRSTIQNWLAKFAAGGVPGLLERDTPPGIISPIADLRVQRQLQEGWKVGRWKSATEVAAWLKEAYGIERSRKSIYYWIGKKARGREKPRAR